MKRTAQVSFVSAVLIFAVLSISGCQEQGLTDQAKQTRLLNAENIRLQHELEKCQEQIEQQKVSGKSIDDVVTMMFEANTQANKQMIEENKNLRAQVEALKQNIEELQNQPEQSKE